MLNRPARLLPWLVCFGVACASVSQDRPSDAAPTDAGPTDARPSDVGAPDAGPSEADASGDSFSAVISGQRLLFDNGVNVSAGLTDGLVHLEVTGSGGHRPGGADDGGAITVALDFEASAPLGDPLRVHGDTRFELPGGTYTYALPDADIHHSAAADASTVVHRVWVRYSCFCSRYFAQSQALQGTLTITSRSASRITGTLHLELDGAIPFWAGGVGGPVVGVFDATFTAAL